MYLFYIGALGSWLLLTTKQTCEADDTLNYDYQCNNWYDEEVMNAQFTNPYIAQPCPCDYEQASVDRRFSLFGNRCVVTAFPFDNHGDVSTTNVLMRC